MRLKKGISVRTLGEFQEFARLFNLERPYWTMKSQPGWSNTQETVSLTHRPHKRYRIISRNNTGTNRESASDFLLKYMHAASILSKSERKKESLNFGFHITYIPEGQDRYTGFKITMDKGRKAEMKKIIKTANEIKYNDTRRNKKPISSSGRF